MGSSPSTIPPPGSGEIFGTASDEYKTSIKPPQYDFVCTTCARNRKHSDASLLCKACRDFLCIKCLQWHFKYRADHIDDMVGQDEMRKLGVQGTPVMPTEKCLAHDGEPWNMFCLKDGVAGCQRCMTQDHRSCGGVIPRSSQQIEATIKQMKIPPSHSDSIDDTKTTRNDGDVLPKPKSDGEVGGKMCEIFGEQMHKNLGEHYGDEDDGQVDGQKAGHSYISDKLQVSREIRNVGRNQNNDQFAGSKKVIKDSTQGRRSFMHNDQVPGSGNQHPDLYSRGRSREVNVGLKGDTQTCDIYDMCLLSDGRILMSDKHNHKLKLLDSNLNMIHHCDIPWYPSGVCMITDTEAVVAMNRFIQFVSIDDKIKIGRWINLFKECDGLVYSNGELYVSDGVTNIHVYTVKGRKLRTIRTGLNDDPIRTGPNDVLEWSHEWLTVSNDGRRLYMTNYRHGIVCLNRLSQKVIWKVKATYGLKYRGVSVDRYNNVFVCRWRKNDVVQFSPDGQLTGVVIPQTARMRDPQSVCIDDVRGRLIVGKKQNNVAKVFDLNY